jgi:opacity protein-like surface antigen
MQHRFNLPIYFSAIILGANIAHNAHAVNPVSGWYAGVFLGASYAPSNDFTLSIPNYLSPINGSLNYSVLGDVGGEIGYRFCERYRLEGEIFYNNSPYNTLMFSALTPAQQSQLLTVFPGITLSGQGISIQSSTTASGLTLQGQTNTGAFMFNGYYDFLSPSEDNYAKIVPYIGAGIGYVYAQNNINFYIDGTQLQRFQLTDVFQSVAGQGIAGVNYFLDDFTTLGIDFRYFTSGNKSQTGNFGYNTLVTNDRFYAINLVFNGIIDGS